MAASTIIVVPGISGSELHTVSGYYPWSGLRVWVGYAALAAGAWRVLGLAPDGVSPESVLYPAIRGGGPVLDFYADLVRYLHQAGYHVVSPPVDWRGTIARDGARLAETILEVGATAPVLIVAHSRGGLVVRSALQQLGSTAVSHYVARVVALGCPHLGSLAAAALLGGWQQTLLLLYHLLSTISVVWSPTNPILDLVRIVRTWPGVYGLLPSPAATWLPAEDRVALYTPAWWTAGGAAVSADWLSASLAAWGSLAAPPAGLSWVDVVGYGTPTPSALTAAPITRPGSLAQDLDGDGTVPVASARYPGGGPAIYAPYTHDGLCREGPVLRAVDQVLRLGLAEDVRLPMPA